MRDYQKWTISIERSLYTELKHMSFDEGMTINEFAKPAVDAFKNELLKLREQTLASRQKQREDAELAASAPPLLVSGHVEESSPISNDASLIL